MKLKTKLMPIACVGLVGASLLPMSLSSCGPKTAANHSFDLTNRYYPLIDRFEPEARKYRVKEVHDIYCSKLQENLDVFAQDYYWSKSWAGT
ncbi:MAG: hypothetical protein KBS35_00850, partial [Mycoplasma sp.]|nr:hypothetical protein [Candidatus Hennigella equi]